MISVQKKSILPYIEQCYNSIKTNDKTSITADNSIKIISSTKGLTFVAHNDAFTIQSFYPLEHNVEEFNIAVNGVVLYNAVKAIRKDIVNFQVDDIILKVSSDKQKFDVNYITSSKETLTSIVGITYDKEIKAAEFVLAVEKTFFNVCKELHNPVLCSVYFGERYVLSADGPRFTAIPKGSIPLTDVAISDKVISTLCNLAKSFEQKTIYYSFKEEGSLYFKVGTTEIRGTRFADKFPSMIENFVKDYDKQLNIHPQVFSDITNSYSSMLSDNFNKLNLTIVPDKENLKEGSFELSINTDSCSAEDTISITNLKNIGQVIAVVFNYKFIKEVLREMKDYDYINISISDDNTKVRFSSPDMYFNHFIGVLTTQGKEDVSN